MTTYDRSRSMVAEVHLINSYTPEGSQFHGYENDTIQGYIDQLVTTMDPEDRDRIAAEAFTICSSSTPTCQSLSCGPR